MAGGLELSQRSRVLVAILATVSIAFVVAGCRQSRPPLPKAVVAEADPMTKAREAMGRRDYGAAAAFLRDLVIHHPADLEAHYRLGVSASHLDQADEAGREFEWIVANGTPGAPEVQLAHNWLASRTAARVPPPTGAAVTAEAPAQKNVDLATLTGRAIGPEGAKGRLRLFLKGVPEAPVRDEYHVLRTDQQGNFRFNNVVPGDYMLTDVIAGPPAWRLRVSLGKAERLVLDLSPSNRAEVRDDFPDARP